MRIKTPYNIKQEKLEKHSYYWNNRQHFAIYGGLLFISCHWRLYIP